MLFIKTLLLFVGFLFLFVNSAVNAENKMPGKNDCVMGVFPFLAPQRLESIFAPIAAELGTVLGCSLRFRSAPSYKIFKEKLKQQEFKIAFVQPFDYVRIASKNGYVPLVTCRDKLNAVIVTMPDSDINSVYDLSKKTIALPPQDSTISYLTRAVLKQAGIDLLQDVTLLYTKNHASCMQKMLIGIADACGTALPPLRLFQRKNNLQLKQIAKSPPIPPSLFVIRDNVSDKLVDKLQQKLLNIKLSADTQRLFFKEGSKNAFRLVADNEYNAVRDIDKCSTVKIP